MLALIRVFATQNKDCGPWLLRRHRRIYTSLKSRLVAIHFYILCIPSEMVLLCAQNDDVVSLIQFVSSYLFIIVFLG